MAPESNIDYGRIHDLTIEEVKACPIFQHFTDSEAQEIVETLKLFTKIAYDFHKKAQKNHGNNIENS